MDKAELIKLLKKSVVPALGCTEPVCTALAAANAAKAIGGELKSIHLEFSRNIYKNSVSVGIPGFDKVGLHYAAALGAYIADDTLGLEIMKKITPEIAEKSTRFAEGNNVTIHVNPEIGGVYVKCMLKTDLGSAVSIIKGGHTNIIYTEKNGEVLFEKKEDLVEEVAGNPVHPLAHMKVSELRKMAQLLTEDEIAFLMDGADMNETLAEYGINENPGIGIAGALSAGKAKWILGDGLLKRVMVRVASATEARLIGCPLATMSSAGSGSKGIAVILPVYETAKAIGAKRLETLQALAFAHMLNEIINSAVGKLSAICACATASATAASAAIVLLMGGTDEQISYAIRNMCGSVTGMICDGGKVGCSLKLATAMGTAFMSAILALDRVSLRVTDGICGGTAEECIHNMGRISSPGMIETDIEILNIMLEKTTAAQEG